MTLRPPPSAADASPEAREKVQAPMRSRVQIAA
jgi:hypothetical protein